MTLQDRDSASPNLLEPRLRLDTDVIASNQRMRVLLPTAARYGQTGELSTLLNQIDDVADRVEGSIFLAALHLASKNDRIEVIKILMKHGADPLKTDSEGLTALHHSVNSKGCLFLSYFLGQRTDSTSTEAQKSCRILSADVPLIKVLQCDGTEDLETPLLTFAAQRGSANAINILLGAGFSAFELDQGRRTALHHGARVGSPKVV